MKTCQGDVWSQDSFRSHKCGNKGKVEHDGKWYCGVHDPQKAIDRHEKQMKEWESEQKAREDKKRETAKAVKTLRDFLNDKDIMMGSLTKDRTRALEALSLLEGRVGA